MRGYALSAYDQIPAVVPTSGQWTRIIVPVVAAAIVLALGLLLVTITSSDASDTLPPAPPTVESPIKS